MDMARVKNTYFDHKMKIFLNLFKEDKAYIWDWIINYFRIENEDRFLKRIDKLCNDNPDYRTMNKEMPVRLDETLED